MCLLSLMVACGTKEGGQPKELPSGETTINEAISRNEVLTGEEIPIDTVLFRYAYRLSVSGDRAVVLDLHNADNYCHVFTFPGFKYLSSFVPRGEGPQESLYADNVRFVGKDTVWVLDDGKVRLMQYSGIADGTSPRLVQSLKLDEKLLRPLDFDLLDGTTALIPDYSGENRFCRVDLQTGKIAEKFEALPEVDKELLKESAPAVAMGWNSFVALSPDGRTAVAATQYGDRLDIYDLKKGKHIAAWQGADGAPQFKTTPEGYSFPTGRNCHYGVQVTASRVYALYDGREFKEVIKQGDAFKQGGRLIRVFAHDGKLLRNIVLDRRIAGLYVDEATQTLYGLDVNADEQIVKWDLSGMGLWK